MKPEIFPWIKANEPRWKISQYAQTLARKHEQQLNQETETSFKQEHAIHREKPEERRWWDN